jgi:hypothetical protein
MKRTIDFPSLPCVVYVWVGPKIGPMLKWLGKKKEFEGIGLTEYELNPGAYRGLCIDLGAFQLVWVSEHNIGLLAHELNHAVMGIMKHTEIDDEEFHCYTLQYLMNQVV